jgi:outer membrane receptor protein involved in Fe transport
LFAEASVYYRDAKDFIHSVLYLSNAQVSQYQNTSKVKISGVEGELRYNYYQKFGAFLNASYQNAVNNTKYPLGTSSGTPEATYLNKIPNQPWFFANAGMNYTYHGLLGQHNDLQLSWDMQYVHWFYLTWEAYGDLDSKSKIPSQYIQNFAIAYSLNDGKYSIGAECRNFTNALAYDNFRLQKPGRSFSVKLRYFFNK